MQHVQFHLLSSGLLLGVVLLSGCEAPDHTTEGAVVGGLGGAGIGALIGNASGHAGAGAAIGAGRRGPDRGRHRQPAKTRPTPSAKPPSPLPRNPSGP